VSPKNGPDLIERYE